MRSIFICFLLSGAAMASQAQTTMDLEACVKFAQQNSILIKQGTNTLASSEIDKRAAKESRYPNASFSGSHSYNFGRSIDPTSNSFEQQTIQSNGFSISGGVPIYNGLRIKHTVEQANLQIAASKEDLQQNSNDLALNVAQAYLNVLLAQEGLEMLKEQAKLTNIQLDRMNKLISSGAMPTNANLELQSQAARNELNQVNAENNITLALLALKQAMNYDLVKEIKILNPKIEVPADIIISDVETIYQSAQGAMPSIRAAAIRESLAKNSEKIAKSGLLPSLSGFYQIRTNYSSLGQRVAGYRSVSQNLGTVNIPSIGEVPLVINSQAPFLEKDPFFNQLGSNFSYALGIQLNAPIYSNYQVKSQVAKAQLSQINAELASEQTRIQLKADITRAMANAKGAHQRYLAAQKSVDISTKSFENVQKRLDLGASNTFELNTAQNSLLLAKSELLQAKYDYFFRLKILDFYQGKQVY